jgi:hypothetical protein
MGSLEYMCETCEIKWSHKSMLILYKDKLLIAKKWSINNADPIFVSKTLEENYNSKILPRTSKPILFVISSATMF